MSGILPLLLLAVPLTALLGIVWSPPPFIEVPHGVTMAFGLLTLAAAIGAVLPIGAAAALGERGWSRSRRGFFVVYACVMFGFAWTLLHWSLLLHP